MEYAQEPKQRWLNRLGGDLKVSPSVQIKLLPEKTGAYDEKGPTSLANRATTEEEDLEYSLLSPWKFTQNKYKQVGISAAGRLRYKDFMRLIFGATKPNQHFLLIYYCILMYYKAIIILSKKLHYVLEER